MKILKTAPLKYTLLKLFLIVLILAFSQQPALSINNIKRVINLSLNENPFPQSKEVNESILKELPGISRYSAVDGENFVKQLAIQEGVSNEQIIPGEILDLLGIYLGLKGGNGGEFIYSVPGYPALVNAAETVGGKILSIPLNAKLENDLESIETHITTKTQAVFLVNPHNPSGTVIDKQLFHDFVKRVSKRTLVIVDEAYLEYTDDFAGRTAVNNVREGDQVIVFRTFAKAYGLAGLSIGYAIAPTDLAHSLKAQGLGDTHALNRLSIVAAEAALKDQENIQYVNKVVAAERDKWNVFLDKSGLQHTASNANFVFFDTKVPYEEVRKKLEEAGILIGREFKPYTTWIRISIGLPEDNAQVRSVIQEIISNNKSGR